MTRWHKSFLHVRTGRRSTTLREIYPECSEEERQLSAEFYERYLTGRGTGDLTPFAGIRQGVGPLAAAQRSNGEAGGAGGTGDSPVNERSSPRPAARNADEDRRIACPTSVSTDGDDPALAHMSRHECRDGKHECLRHGLGKCLTDALGESLPEIGEVDVAVSGGIDSWLLAAMLRTLGYRVRGWYLESGISGYCERDQVERFSDTLGILCRYIKVAASDFLASVPEFLSVTETPIYNLHPVSKWLLAKALRREGISTLVTGDGADQVMRHEWDCDLLPLTLACFQSAGVRLIAPFLAAPVIGFCRVPHPDKGPIRELARQLGVPSVPKHPTLFPAVELPMHPRALLPGMELGGRRPAFSRRTDDERRSSVLLLSYTTGLLIEALEEHKQCAGSLA